MIRSLVAAIALGALVACTPTSKPVPESGGPCQETSYMGFPKLEPPLRSSFFACRKGFALQYAVPVRSSLWVSQHLRAEDLDELKFAPDRNGFRPDGFLPEEITPTPNRFTRTGYTLGHLAPPEDYPKNAPAISHSHYTSNVVAQDPGNDAGIWRRLEENVRAWARSKGEVYVVSGPIYYAGNRPFTPQGWLSLTDGRPAYIIEEYYRDETDKERREREKRRGGNAIAVPSHLFKVIFDPSSNTAIAFVVPNQNVPASSLPQYATTVAEVERLTNLRFFPHLPMEAQAALKTRVDAQSWLLGR